MAELKTILQNFVRCCLWALALLLWMVVMCWDTFMNFTSIRAGTEYLSQKAPLSDDPLLGVFIAAFGLGDADNNYLFAGLVAVVLNVIIFAAIHQLKQIISILPYMLDTDNREYSRDTDNREYSRQDLQRTLLNSSINLALWTVPLCFIVPFDLDMFRYQTLFDALSQSNNQATLDLSTPTWEVFEKNNPHSALINTGNAKAYCYIAIAVAGAFLFDTILRRFHCNIAIFYDSLFRGWDDEAHVPDRGDIAPVLTQTASTHTSNPKHADNNSAPESSVNPPQTLSGASEEDTKEIEVLGSNPVTSIPFHEARSNPQYHVDDEGRVWDRQFYQEIHGK